MPFTLTHPKPQPQLELSKSENTSQVKEEKSDAVNNGNDQTVPVDLNLIEFDTNVTNGKNKDDDLIFEEFARIRLKGHDADDTDV